MSDRARWILALILVVVGVPLAIPVALYVSWLWMCMAVALFGSLNGS